MKPLALLGIALALLAGACGGAADAESSDLPTADVLARYVAAVRSGDAAAVMDLFSERCIDRYDLTEEKVEASFIPAVQTDLRTVGRSSTPAFEQLLGDPEAKLWIDGRELPLKRQPGSGSPVMFEARPRRGLAPGRHLVVVFAQVGDRIGALAWLSMV